MAQLVHKDPVPYLPPRRCRAAAAPSLPSRSAAANPSAAGGALTQPRSHVPVQEIIERKPARPRWCTVRPEEETTIAGSRTSCTRTRRADRCPMWSPTPASRCLVQEFTWYRQPVRRTGGSVGPGDRPSAKPRSTRRRRHQYRAASRPVARRKVMIMHRSRTMLASKNTLAIGPGKLLMTARLAGAGVPMLSPMTFGLRDSVVDPPTGR